MHMAKSTYYFEISKKDAVAERNRVLLEEISKIYRKFYAELIEVYISQELKY